MSQKKYITSNLLFIHPDYPLSVASIANQQKFFSSLDPKIYDVLWCFLNPFTLQEALLMGVDEDAVQQSIEIGLLLEYDSVEHRGVSMWERFNWSRAAFLHFSQLNLRYDDIPLSQKPDDYKILRQKILKEYTLGDAYPKKFKPQDLGKYIKLNFDKSKLKKDNDFNIVRDRKAVRSFSDESVTFSIFEKTLQLATDSIHQNIFDDPTGGAQLQVTFPYSWFCIYVVVQNVQDVEPGVYYYDIINSRLSLVRKEVSTREIYNCIQGQNWIKGGGFCLFFGIHWPQFAWIYRHSRAYTYLIIQLGEMSERFVLSAYQNGLGGWMTPAVHESKANKLCQIDTDDLDIMFFMKFGFPKQQKI